MILGEKGSIRGGSTVCNTYGTCIKSILLQEEVLKTMMAGFQAPELFSSESGEKWSPHGGGKWITTQVI